MGSDPADDGRVRQLEAELAACRRELEAVSATERRYRALVESAQDLIFVVGRDGRVEYANPHCAAGLRRQLSDIVGRTVPELFPPAIAARQSANLKRVFHSGEPLYFTGITPFQGRNVWLETWLIPSLGETGEVVSVIGVSRDVTARHDAVEELRQNEARLRAVLASSPMVLWMLDRELRFTFASGRGWAGLERTPESLVGRSWFEAFEPSPRLRECIERALAGEEGSEVIAEGPQTLRVYASPLRAADGTITGLIGVSTDITRERALEQEAARAQKLEALGLLAGGIAHDFNNLLSVIMSNISLARTRVQGEPEVCERLAAAERACPRARDITRQLLTFAKGGAPLTKVTSLRTLISEAAEFALSGSRCTLSRELPEDLWLGEVDEGQLSQVVQNLVLNAVQAMPEGGTVRVAARNAQVGPERALPLRPGRYVEAWVSDEGDGIAAEHRSHLFDPFFTTKAHGMGLGLTITYSILKRHQGHVLVESELGRGTTFRFFVPATDRAAPPEPPPVAAARIGGERILFMDDEQALRDVAAEMLEELGYDVTTASNGADAVRLYGDALRDGRRFAAAILDLTVPGGTGGQEAATRILALDPEARLLVSSGYADNRAISEYGGHGFAGALIKPYGLTELAEALSEVLASTGS